MNSEIDGTVELEKQGDSACIWFNRPQARNAFNKQQRLSLLAALEDCEADPNIRAIVLAGRGAGFCAGADLTEGMGDVTQVSDQIIGEYKPSIMLMHQSPKLYIAAVNGAAAGIGSAFAMACDYLLMEESAYIYQAFAAIALVPDGGATWQLVRTLGYRRALQMIVEGEKLPAEDCVALGLANRVVADGKVVEEALALAARLAKGAPLAQQYAKALCKEAMLQPLSEMIDREAQCQNTCITSADCAEGIDAFFNKRQAVFKGE